MTMTWVDQELELPENKIYILYHTQKTNDIDNFNRKSHISCMKSHKIVVFGPHLLFVNYGRSILK